jgi:uncharacterized protein YjbI with pentapeptide repeats
MNVPSSIKTILVLTANPKSTLRLRLDEQVRDIKQGLERSQNRDQFNLVQEWAVRPRDIQRAMLDIKPNIVHFSGHGNGDDGLVFEDENGNPKLVEGAALARLFYLFSDTIECVVLNGCYSAIQAESISQYIENVIGMTELIGDQAAIEFSVGFYDALGAGRTVDFAYKLGCSAIRLSGIPEESVPILIKKRAISTQSNDSKVEWMMILSGTFDDKAKEKAEIIIEHLRELSGDTSLTLKRISPGSIVLTIEGSQESFKIFDSLFRSNKLNVLIGIPIENIFCVSNSSQSGIRNATSEQKQSISHSLELIDIEPELNTSPQKHNGHSSIDFSDHNLKGRDFKGMMLSGANFSGANIQGANFTKAFLEGANFTGADIRGTNFTKACLREADFTRSKSGVQYIHSTFLFVAALILVMALEGIGGGIGWLVMTFLKIEAMEEYFIFSAITCVVLAVLFIIIIQRGYSKAREAWGTSEFSFLIVTSCYILAALGAILSTTALILTISKFYLAAVLAAIFTAPALIIPVFLAVGAAGFSEMYFLSIIVAVLLVSTIIGGSATFLFASHFCDAYLAILGALVLQLAGAFTSIFSGIHLTNNSTQFSNVRLIVVNFISWMGTSFRNADLTRAIFSKAILKRADFREATITHTSFLNSKYLHQARQEQSDYSVLHNPSIRNLIVTGNGQNQQYIRSDLRGVCLDGANLENANLTGADLTGGTFKRTNLQNANLTGVKAIGTDFTEAHLTGACLQSWNIDGNTIFHNVYCKYFYELENANDYGNRERRPHDPDKFFEFGDFEEYNKQSLNILYLMIRKGINPKAFAAAFDKLIKEFPGVDFNSIKNIDKKGDDVIVGVQMPTGTDKGVVERTFDTNYQYKLQTTGDSTVLTSPASMVLNFNINTTARSENNMNNDRTINTGGGNYIESNSGTYIQGNYINMGQDLDQAASQIQDLINQLQKLGMTDDLAREYVSNDLATQAQSNSIVKSKLLTWGQSLGSVAVNEVIKNVVKAALSSAGIILS